MHGDPLVSRFFLALVFSVTYWSVTGATDPPYTALAFSPDNQQLTAVSQAGLRVFDWPELIHRHTIAIDIPNLHAVEFSPSGTWIAVAGGFPAEQGVASVLTWPQGEINAQREAHEDSIRCITWLNDAQLISGSLDRSIKIWNRQEDTTLKRLDGHSRSVDALCLLREKQILVSAGADQTLRVWNLQTNQLIRNLNQHTGPIHDLARNPKTSGLPMIASASADHTIRFWQPTIGRMVRYARLDAIPLCLQWLADGHHIVAGCDDGSIRIIDSLNLRTVNQIKCFDGWVYAVQLHPTDGSIAVAGTNHQIRCYTIESLFGENGTKE